MWLSGVLSLLLLLPTARASLPLVAVDPGHGGEQQGAVGVCGACEKDVTLAVSLELTKLLVASGRVRVLLTRSDDRDVDLEARASMANAAGARIFLSIHANASKNEEATGIETFFLSRRASSRRIRELAARENLGRAALFASEPDTLQVILDGLRFSSAHHHSQRLALQVQRMLSKQLHTRGRGVLQAPFVVLTGAEMAAALVELGFLTNRQECQRLARPDHHHQLARSLAAAVLSYLAKQEAQIAQLP